MSISKILKLDPKEVSASQKLAKIAKEVTAIRKEYKNSEIELAVPEYPTVEQGVMPLSALSDETKLALVEKEISRFIQEVVETTKNNPAIVAAKESEKLVATSPLLANLDAECDLGCL